MVGGRIVPASAAQPIAAGLNAVDGVLVWEARREGGGVGLGCGWDGEMLFTLCRPTFQSRELACDPVPRVRSEFG